MNNNSEAAAQKFGPDCLTRLLGALFPLLNQPYRDIFHSVDFDLLFMDACDNMLDYGVVDYDCESELASLRELHQNEALKGNMTICNPLASLNDASVEFIPKLIDSALKNLSSDGCAALIVPLNLLSNGGRMADIIGLVESNDLLAVIQLPDKLFAPAFDMTSCLLLVDRKRDTNQILFIKPDYVKADDISHDERELIRNYCTHAVSNWKESALISSDDIRSRGYQLSPTIYVSSLSAQLEQFQEKGSCKSLGEICKVQAGMQPEKNAQKLNIVARVDSDIAIKDYTHPCNNYEGLLRRSLGLTPAWTFSSEHAAILGKCLLATFDDTRIAAQIFDPSESFRKWPHEEEGVIYRYEGINIGKDIVALFPDENVVTIEYLYYQLYTPLVTMQIEAMINESDKMNSDPFNERVLNDMDWEKIIIPVPDLSTQEAFCEKQKEEIIKNAELKQQREYEALVKKINGTDYKRSTQYDVIRSLRHEVLNNLCEVKDVIERIERFIISKDLQNEVFFSNETAGTLIGAGSKQVRYIQNLLDAYKEFAVAKFDREDFEIVDICQLFKDDIEPRYVNKPYLLTVDCDKACGHVLLHKTAFRQAIHNFIINAENHAAFNDSVSHPELSFLIRQRKDQIVIDYTNNGKPLPRNMTYELFAAPGEKGPDSQGEGLGGAWIAKFVEAHHGSGEIIRETDYPVHFRIMFPKGG